MNITVKDDEGTTEEVGAGSEISLAVGTLLPKGVNRRVITIERPVEKTPGEKLCDCFVDAGGWPEWRNQSETGKSVYEKAAKLFTDRHLSPANRDWEERRTFVGVSTMGPSEYHSGNEQYVGDFPSSQILRWTLGHRVRVHVDRIKEP